MIDVSIGAIAKRLATQDNACTAHPIFVVQQRERQTGIDTQWTDDIAWIDDEGEVDPSDPDWTKAEEHYQETGEELWWTRTGYVDRWVFVQPFFTRAAAEAYIEANSHRLTEPRVYVDSAYRNPEWQAIVVFLPAALRCIDAGRAAVRYFGHRIEGWDVRVARRLLKGLSEALGEAEAGDAPRYSDEQEVPNADHASRLRAPRLRCEGQVKPMSTRRAMPCDDETLTPSIAAKRLRAKVLLAFNLTSDGLMDQPPITPEEWLFWEALTVVLEVPDAL